MSINKGACFPLLCVALPAAAAVFGAPVREKTIERVRWLMGTACLIQAEETNSGAAATAAFEEIERWDRILSLYKEKSELSALNRSAGTGPFRASPALYAAVETALRLAHETQGAFDPTILPVLRRGPEDLGLVGWNKVRLDPAAGTIELPLRGMGLDLGGIGKGWALDRAADVLRERGVTRAFINFGGQILALGAPRGRDAWTVRLPGVEEPIMLRDASVSTSGDSQRPGHISSPFDGGPLRRKFSATAILACAAEADAWSTALYVLGTNPPSFRGRSLFVPTAAKKVATVHKGGPS
ncbi:MAG TPA: hypothetical protein DCZ01_00290 [Elusimicrobia bacterium]|nr:MAG: hypothetical protein A2X37_08475 [Elusimicrobia bacterium GWA2_66_18]OGR73377.1 MAG: hypothetical protein A2X40_00140 [Elusimicrobia bacterium GWC2_65_9]HAZ06971.1 hypothetical protein [Elusimicrobiota bacterium]